MELRLVRYESSDTGASLTVRADIMSPPSRPVCPVCRSGLCFRANESPAGHYPDREYSKKDLVKTILTAHPRRTLDPQSIRSPPSPTPFPSADDSETQHEQ